MAPPAPNSNNRVLVLGGQGFLGQQICGLFPQVSDPALDIADPGAVALAMEESWPDVVINCAGKTGRPNIDWCETHRLETLRSNVTGALVVLEACQQRGIYLVHLSSGCIYQGDNGGAGFTEDDAPNYLGSYYSRTKIWSDQILCEFPVLVLRLRMPFDSSASDRNLIVKLRRYGRVLTAPNSLTYLPDFFQVLRALIAGRETGIYHVVNEGVISPYEIMTLYRDIVDPTHTFTALEPAQLGEVATAGRSNCRLSTAKLRAKGLAMQPVRAAVLEALRGMAGVGKTSPRGTGGGLC
ncbi:MAG: sugar nucleotide-binding protein [Gemmataceae bacterium]